MNIIDQINTMRRRTDLTREEKNIEEDRLFRAHHVRATIGFRLLDHIPGLFSREPALDQSGVYLLAGPRYCDLAEDDPIRVNFIKSIFPYEETT